MIWSLASFIMPLVFLRSSPGFSDVAGGLDVVGVDGLLEMACSLDAAGSLAGSLDAAGLLAVAGSLDGAGSLLDTEGSGTGDAEGEAAEEDSAGPSEVNVLVSSDESDDCSEP